MQRAAQSVAQRAGRHHVSAFASLGAFEYVGRRPHGLDVREHLVHQPQRRAAALVDRAETTAVPGAVADDAHEQARSLARWPDGSLFERWRGHGSPDAWGAPPRGTPRRRAAKPTGRAAVTWGPRCVEQLAKILANCSTTRKRESDVRRGSCGPQPRRRPRLTRQIKIGLRRTSPAALAQAAGGGLRRAAPPPRPPR